MSPPGVASPMGGESTPPRTPDGRQRRPAAAPSRLTCAPVINVAHVPAACPVSPPAHHVGSHRAPTCPTARPTGPSSPRAAWPNTRGTSADALANALSKGSPRGITPTSSNAALAAAQAPPPPAASAPPKLKPLQTLPTFLSPAPSGAIPNQGEGGRPPLPR